MYSEKSAGPGMLFFTFLALMAWSHADQAPGHSDSNQLLSSGTKEAAQGNISAARADIEAAVALNPANAAGWYQMGVLLGQTNDFRGAEAAFRKSIQLQANVAKAHYSLGLTLIADPRSRLDWPGAMAEFREAIRIQPDYPEALNLLGLGLVKTGKADAAVPELQKAIDLNPNLPETHFNLAIAWEESGKLDQAVQEYRVAVAKKEHYPEASTALGKLLSRMGKSQEAAQELNEALRGNPDLGDAHYALGRALQAAGQAVQANLEFEQAKDLGQREADAAQSSTLSNLSLELAAKSDMKGAVDSLRKAVALKPDYGIPNYNLGLILADMEDLDGASQALIKAISLLPGQAKPWLNLGRVRKGRGDLEGALEAVTWAARLAPADASIQAELKALRAVSPKFAEWKLSYVPKLGAASDTAPDHLNFAAELRARGDTLGEIGELRRVLAIQPACSEARRQLAGAYERLGDDVRTRLEYYKALCLLPEDAALRLTFGEFLLRRGLRAEAEGQFRSVLTRQPDSAKAREGLKEAEGTGH